MEKLDSFYGTKWELAQIRSCD